VIAIDDWMPQEQLYMHRKTYQAVEKVTAGFTRKWAGLVLLASRKNLKPEICL